MSTFQRKKESAKDLSMKYCEQTLSGTATTGDPTGRRYHPHLPHSGEGQQHSTNHTKENGTTNIGGKSGYRLFQAM